MTGLSGPSGDYAVEDAADTAHILSKTVACEECASGKGFCDVDHCRLSNQTSLDCTACPAGYCKAGVVPNAQAKR